MTFVATGIGIFKLRIQSSSDPSVVFQSEEYKHGCIAKLFQFSFGWHQYSVVFFKKYIQEKKKKNIFVSLLSFYSQSIILLVLNCLRVSEKPCTSCTSAWIFVHVFAVTLLWMHAPLVQDQLLPTFICRAILKLTWFVWHWFQLCGPFGSC